METTTPASPGDWLKSLENTRLSRRRFLQASAGTALAMCSGACDSSRPTASPGTLRIAGNTFGFPSPFAYIAGPGYVQMSFIYDTLVWKDGSGRLLPWLARSYERSRDGRTYTFRLRSGVRWHDGRPLTAHDVAFTFEYFLAQPLGPLLVAQPSGVAGARALVRDAVEVHLDAPAVTFLEQVAGALPIVPQHIWSRIDDAPRVQELDVLVGTGAYRLASFSRGEGSLAYSANADYFLGRPFVRRLELRPVEDELSALRAGALDVAETPVDGVPPEVLAFSDDASFGVIHDTGGFTFPLIWNVGRGGALADVRFRRACTLAIDRKDIVQRLLGGNGAPGNPGFLAPGHPFGVHVEQYVGDIQVANRLLDDAGYSAASPGETRRDRQGRPLRFDILTGNAPVPAALPLIIDAFRKIGVELRAQSVDLPTLFGRLQDHDNDLAISLYPGPGGTSPQADPDVLRSFYSSRSEGRLQGAQGWSDAEFDRLAQQQLHTLDWSKRARLIARMQHIVARDLPALPLYYPTLFAVFRKQAFNAWYYTPGGFAGGLPGIVNKHALITGRKTGLRIRKSPVD